VISPKIRTNRVSRPVAYPIALDPNSSIVRVVVSDEAEIFTRLFPIRIQLSILLCESRTLRAVFARTFPACARFRIRIRFTVVSAVSADEKNAESKRSRISPTIFMRVPEDT
jgi:hypothetical protein